MNENQSENELLWAELARLREEVEAKKVSNLVESIRSLTADEIQDRLDALAQDEAILRTVLRSARAKERAQREREKKEREKE